jgi:hypothetical protein
VAGLAVSHPDKIWWPHLEIFADDVKCTHGAAEGQLAREALFYLESRGHKAFGPTGIGVLYGKEAWLERMPPYQGGGDMIKAVSFERTIYNDLPYKFEAGTPHIGGAIGLATALEYVAGLGFEGIGAWEHDLLTYDRPLTAGPGPPSGRPRDAGARGGGIPRYHPTGPGPIGRTGSRADRRGAFASPGGVGNIRDGGRGEALM